MDARAWVAGREPPVPPALARALTEALAEPGEPEWSAGSDRSASTRAAGEVPRPGQDDEAPWSGERLVRRLADAGQAALSASLGNPGRNRQAAFDLLVADALITYACEACLELDDPDAAWERVVARCGTR